MPRVPGWINLQAESQQINTAENRFCVLGSNQATCSKVSIIVNLSTIHQKSKARERAHQTEMGVTLHGFRNYRQLAVFLSFT